MPSSVRHITWEAFRQQVLDPGIPARIAVGGQPPLWLAVQGRRLSLSAQVPADANVPVSPLKQIQVVCRRDAGGLLLELSTDREHLYREFFFLSLGIVDVVQSHGQTPIAAFSDALSSWKQLLEAASRMSPEQEIGLIGELWLLERLARRSATEALNAWTGPLGEPHDFRTASVEVEVKSTRSADRVHVVHGLKQLVASTGRRLFLLSLQWEPAGDSAGQSLPSYIEMIRFHMTRAPNALAVFEQMLRTQRLYRDEDASLYTERVRLRTLPTLIEVTATFPRLTSDLVRDALGETAARISDVSYRINVDGLGVPEGHAEFARVLNLSQP